MHEIAAVTQITVTGGIPVYMTKILALPMLSSATQGLYATRWGTAFDGDVVWNAYISDGSIKIRAQSVYNQRNSVTNAVTWYYVR